MNYQVTGELRMYDEKRGERKERMQERATVDVIIEADSIHNANLIAFRQTLNQNGFRYGHWVAVEVVEAQPTAEEYRKARLEAAVISKLKAEGLSLKSPWSEIENCFKTVVAPTACIEAARRLVEEAEK